MALLKNKYGGWFEIPDEELDINKIMNKKIRNKLLDKYDNITTITLASNGNNKTIYKFITDDNKTISNVTYIIKNGEYNIYDINTEKSYRRKGYATKLMKSVQREAGNKDINFGTLKHDGEKLLRTITETLEVEDGLLGAKIYKGKIKL